MKPTRSATTLANSNVNSNVNIGTRPVTRASAKAVSTGNLQGRAVQRQASTSTSANATQQRIKLWGPVTALISFISENHRRIQEWLSQKVVRPVFSSDHKNEFTRDLINLNMQRIRELWMGDTNEKTVTKRLGVLGKEDLLQDKAFKDFSFYSLIEMKSSKGQYKLKWIKDGEIHSCTLDVISKAPKVVITDIAGKQTEQNSVHDAIRAQVGHKFYELSTIEQLLKEFNAEQNATKKSTKQDTTPMEVDEENDNETEEMDTEETATEDMDVEREETQTTHCGPNRFIPEELRVELGIDNESDGEESSAVDSDSEASDIEDETETVTDADESDAEVDEAPEEATRRSRRLEFRRFIQTRSYMTLRMTEKERLEGKAHGKRVYHNASDRYFNPKKGKDAPMKRYFPPAHKLPNNCR